MLNKFRNIRKRWIVISAVGALLAIALVSGVALAADARSDLMANTLHDGYGYGRHGKSNSDALLLRVAEIVGVEQSTLVAAFGTARSEQVDARFDSYAGLLVAGGELTQDQADEADTWFSDRPAGLDWATERMAASPPSEQSTARLTRLVSAGQLSQEEAESIASWHADRPDFLPEAAAGHRAHSGADWDDRRGGFAGKRGHR